MPANQRQIYGRSVAGGHRFCLGQIAVFFETSVLGYVDYAGYRRKEWHCDYASGCESSRDRPCGISGNFGVSFSLLRGNAGVASCTCPADLAQILGPHGNLAHSLRPFAHGSGRTNSAFMPGRSDTGPFGFGVAALKQISWRAVLFLGCHHGFSAGCCASPSRCGPSSDPF